MNVLYCGDKNIEDGLLISVLSLLRTTEEELHIYVLTMQLEYEGKQCLPVRDEFIGWLDGLVKERCAPGQTRESDRIPETEETGKGNSRIPETEETGRGNSRIPETEETGKGNNRIPETDETGRGNSRILETDETEAGGSFVKKIDLSEEFAKKLPIPNMQTRFTPCCMLRLFADEVPELPARILYLDTDIVCRRDISGFYHQNMEGWEIAGVLDYYGRWFFHKKRWMFWKWDYLNSGVLLLNMEEIRKTGLFAKCREMCAETEMFMPDQSSLNKLAVAKKICPRRFNDQRKLHRDTVVQHFTTSFRFFPWIRTVSVKPWEIERVHEVLKLHEYDELLGEYERIKRSRDIAAG